MKENEILKLIIEQSLAGYWDWNIKEGTVYLSPAFKKMFGYEDDEMNNTIAAFKALLFKEDVLKPEEIFKQHIESKGAIPFNTELRCHHKNGSTVWIMSTGQIIEWDADVQPVRMVGCHMDITQQKKLEEKLRGSQNTLSLILDTLPQAVFWKDRNHVFLGCNKAFAKNIGLDDPTKVIGKTAYDLGQSKEDVEKFHAYEKEIIDTNKAKLHIIEHALHAGEKKVWLDASKVPLTDSSGVPNGVLHIYDDVTEQKNVEKELQHANRLYNISSKVNRSLIDVSSRKELYEKVCKIIVEHDAFKLAWIGENDPATNKIEIIAADGVSKDYTKNLNVYSDARPEGLGPTGVAFRERRIVIANQFASASNTKPWHKAANQFGLKASMAVPFLFKDEVVGVLTAYSSETDFFLDKERALLEELATDISLALTRLEQDKQHKQWENSVLQAKEDWERTFDAVSDMIAILDKDHNIVRVNKAMADKLSLIPDACTGKKCYHVIHNTECPIAGCPHTLLMQDGKEHRKEVSEDILGGDCIVTTSPIYDTNGILIGSVHIARDITEQKKAQDALLRNEALLRTTIQNAPIVLYTIDLNGIFRLSVGAGLTRLGFQQNEVVGKSVFDVYKDVPDATEPIKEALKGKTLGYTVYFEAVDAYIEGYYTPLFNANNELIGTVGLGIDITERRKAAKRIQQLADIIEHSNAFVGIANIDRTFVYLNNACKKAFLIKEDEDITQLNVDDFHTKMAKAIIAKAIAQIKETGEWVGENEMMAKDGRVIPVIQVIRAHKNEESIIEYTSTTAIDITELKKKEQELTNLTNDLRSLSAYLQNVREEERKHIAKEIHDELGQNLTVLKMAAAWISSHIDDDRKQVEERLQQLKNITDNTVETSRRLYNSLHPQMLDDMGLIETIRWHSKAYTKNTNIEVSVRDSFKGLRLFKQNHATRIALFRIYQECMTNVLRHANATNVNVELSMQGDDLIMTIEDNGVGFNVDAVDTTLHHGLLGIRERVYALNGNFSITSKIGKGTKTEITVPLTHTKHQV